MNSQIERLDKRIKLITKAEDKKVKHIRNMFTNKLRSYQGDMYLVDIRLEGADSSLAGYQYITSIPFSACGFNFIIDIVID